MAKVYTPSATISNQKIVTTKEDRARDVQQFKERKAEQERIKTERFAKIKDRKKNKPGGGSGGLGGRGINIEIKGE